MPLDLRVVDRRAMDPLLARALAELLCSVWPDAGKSVEDRTRSLLNDWRGYDGPAERFPRAFVVFEQERPVSHACVFPREIAVGSQTITVGALGGVCAHADFRGRGLGVAVVQESFALVDRGVFDFVLFQNYREYQPFYEKLGAGVITNRIYNSLAEEPDGNPFWADVAMAYAGGREWPAGDVDLRGPGY